MTPVPRTKLLQILQHKQMIVKGPEEILCSNSYGHMVMEKANKEVLALKEPKSEK